MKKIFIFILLSFFYTNFSKACDLLNVPIGSNVKNASAVFAFLEDYDPEIYNVDHPLEQFVIYHVHQRSNDQNQNVHLSLMLYH